MLERIIATVEVQIVDHLPSSARGANGFGRAGLVYLSGITESIGANLSFSSLGAPDLVGHAIVHDDGCADPPR
eukprot:4098624-Pyramimonas_sp.AAC.1